MITKLLRRMRAHWKRSLLIVLVLGFVALNALAFMHAWSMTHFVEAGERPLGPEQMSLAQKARAVLFGFSVPKPRNLATPTDFELPFTTHSFNSADGTRLEAWHIPRQDARGMVILFHGYISAKAALLGEAKAFRRMGYETLLVDFRASGGSAGHQSTIGWREADDVAAAVEFARRQFRPARLIIYAQSMGAAAVMRAIAERGVSCDALIVEAAFDRLLNTVANRFTYMHLPSFPLARMLMFWGSVQQGCWTFAMNPAEYATRVRCPTLHLLGKDDPWVLTDEAQHVTNNLAGPKQFVSVPNVDHGPCMSGDPRLWSQTISTFLAPLVTSAPASQSSTLEPGQAESRDRAARLPLPKEWSKPASEVRGVWISSGEMLLPREKIIANFDALTSANFNTVLIDTYFRGYVAYPGSAHLPQFADFRGEDVLGWMIDQAHQRGLRAELWMEYGFYSYFTPDATKDMSMGPILDAHPELLSVDFEGHRFIHRAFGDFYSICPSNPMSHELLAGIFAEAATRYPCDGVNLDRIRYADVTYCACGYCKARFKKDSGIDLKPFAPASDEAKQWLDWKRRQTLKAVETIVTKVRKAKPGITITSYVLGPDEMDSKSQGWDLWMKAGLLDAVAVSMYGADVRDTSRRAIALLGGDASRLISAISCEQDSPVYLTNIEVSRGFKGAGQFTWHQGALGADDIEGLKSGPYQTTAKFQLKGE